MNKSDIQHIGVLAKLHGFKGKYVLISESYVSEEIENWESIFIEIEGLLVPFFIEDASVISENSAFISFEGIDTSEKAKEFLYANVYQKSALTATPEADDSLQQLIGYNVIDKIKGKIGAIDKILDYNENLLFSIQRNNIEILIPVVEKFILNVNHATRVIFVETPEGLLEINGF